MTGALLHFEKGVPIDDLAIRKEQKESMMRVQHVYWQWVRNPFSIDPRELFRQLVKGKYQGTGAECNAINRDMLLFNFVKESVTTVSRREAEVKAKVAIDKMLTIGMQTDNVAALDKGTKHIITLAGLDKPESEKADLAKTAFLQPVVVTNVREIDESKEDLSDEQSLAIMKQYNAYIDEKRVMVDDRVKVLEARSGKPDTEEAESDE